jgi:glycosyltransferase involved in cell wall biosynthesis
VSGRVLVVTTVHHPDDNRIREKTIRTLAGDFEVTFAVRTPGPTDHDGLTWVPLPGGRIRRNLAAWRVVMSTSYDVLSIHDPELVPLGVVARLIRRKPVVFDMHEDVPGQILTKTWVPGPLRRPVAALARMVLHLGERILVFTLAEPSYSARLRAAHRVIANHPDVGSLPLARGPSAGAIYVGDVTIERGLGDAIEACASVGLALTVVGPMSEPVEASLRAICARIEADVVFTGRLPFGAAMERVASAAVALSPLRDLPNYRHSIPTKVLEYLAIGVPVVASDLPATRAVVAGLAAVFLHDPGDVEAIIASLRAALEPGVEEVARRQAADVRARFGWPAEELLDVYRSAIR